MIRLLVGNKLAFLDKNVHSEFWAGTEELLATAIWMREPLYVIDEQIDGKQDCYAQQKLYPC